MRIHREQIAACLALILVAFAARDLIGGFISPARGLEPQPYSVRDGGRDILRRKYRRYEAESETGRNPFSFSEGWERLEVLPIDPPSVPIGTRPVPFTSFGPSILEAGVIFENAAPAKRKGSTP